MNPARELRLFVDRGGARELMEPTQLRNIVVVAGYPQRCTSTVSSVIGKLGGMAARKFAVWGNRPSLFVVRCALVNRGP